MDPKTCYLSWERMLFSAFFSSKREFISSKIARRPINVWWKPTFHRRCAHGTRLRRVKRNTYLAAICEFFFCGAGSQLWVHEKKLVSRFWLPTTAVRLTRRRRTPHKEHAVLLFVRSCPQVKCKLSVGGCFCLILYTQNFDLLRSLQHLKVEV